MSDFHALVAAVHGEVWQGGAGARPELCALLAELDAAPLPAGVTRLATACMAPGPHLAEQDGDDTIPEPCGLFSRREAARR